MTGELSFLTLGVDFVLALLWLTLAGLALLWLAVAGGLVRSAVTLISSCGARVGRFSVQDIQLLRSMHIRP
jgi:hypothetical protein